MLKANVNDTIAALDSILPEVDKRALLENKDLGTYLVDAIAEALKSSSDGWVDDDLAFIQPWGVDLKDIRVPVSLYQGDVDAMVPFAHGKWLASNIPKEYLIAHLELGEGHISIYLGKADGMISDLVNVGSK